MSFVIPDEAHVLDYMYEMLPAGIRNSRTTISRLTVPCSTARRGRTIFESATRTHSAA